MGRRLLKFWFLTRREKQFFVEAGLLLLVSYACVMAMAFRHIDGLLSGLWKNCSESAFDRAEDIRLIKLSLARATTLLRWKRLCLSRSIAAFIMLRRRGIPAAMVAGVKFSEDSSLLAHAWVDIDGGVIGGTTEDSGFTTLVRIGQESADH